MGNWEKQQEAKNEVKERDKTRKESLSKYCYDLSKLAFAGMVIGGLMTLVQGTEVNITLILFVIFGVVLMLMLARIGNNILK